MRATLRALRFIAANTLRPCSDAPGEALTLTLPDGGSCPAALYEPAGRPAGLIVFVHGMSRAGRDDPRVRRASRALSKAGFRVLTPAIADIAALRITFGTADSLAEVLRAIDARPDLTGGRAFGVFSVSYSAAVSLLASARPQIAPMLSAICALGTFSNAVRWARFLVTQPGADSYARLLVYRNLLHHITGPRPAVDAALDVAIDDDWNKRPKPELAAVLPTLTAEDRALVEQIVFDPVGARVYGEPILERVGPSFGPLDVEAHATQLHVPTILLHGARDVVIPPDESVALHAALTRVGTPSRLTLTPLIDHGDSALSLRTLPDVIHLIASFREFFSRVEAGAVRR